MSMPIVLKNRPKNFRTQSLTIRAMLNRIIVCLGSLLVLLQPGIAFGADRPLLEYRWNSDTIYRWDFEIKVKSDGSDSKHTGTASFRAHPKQPTGVVTKKRTGTGTGFVVHHSGLVVTCAHVVDSASSVRVRFGDKVYPATVISSDVANDLSLLKIVPSSLAPLPLASDESIELGQEIRSVGYPLSDMLGKSVKITRGTVSGKLQLENRELYQIDAAINPGNSGGPIVDNRGNVVGVASEKIHGQGISNIGFCVPSKTLAKFLKEQNVVPKTQNTQTEVDGPTLAKSVIPSVGLVEVELGAEKSFELVDLSEFNQNPARHFGNLTNRLRLERGKLEIDNFGNIQDSDGALESPILLGPVASLPLVPLPRPWQTNWGASSEIKLSLFVSEAVQDPLQALLQQRLYRFRRPLEPQYKVVTIDATQTDALKIASAQGDIVSIERECILVSQVQPKFDHRITWKYKFDVKKAVVVEAQGDGELKIDGKQISTIEVSLKFKTSNDEVAASSNSTSSAVTEKSNTTMPAELKVTLEKLADEKTTQSDRVEQLMLLADMQWDSRFRRKVVDGISAQLDQRDEPVVLAALKALTNWDAATCVEQAVPLLKHKSPRVRNAVVEYLGSMQDGAASPALFDALEHVDLRDAIYKAMRSIGPTGESGVIKMLSHPDDSVRIQGCLILEELGSKKCAESLKKLARTSGNVGLQAKKTLAKLGLGMDSSQNPKEDAEEVNPFETKKKPGK